jgi:hypothetical protein
MIFWRIFAIEFNDLPGTISEWVWVPMQYSGTMHRAMMGVEKGHTIHRSQMNPKITIELRCIVVRYDVGDGPHNLQFTVFSILSVLGRGIAFSLHPSYCLPVTVSVPINPLTAGPLNHYIMQRILKKRPSKCYRSTKSI